MATPRIFVSSTYFDLRVIRADLERFIKEMGYEPILFERGHVAYGKDESLESYCYREISSCDILISIIGGKHGSPSTSNEYSITQNELKKAVEFNKQIYIFVGGSVLTEYHTYLKNKDNSTFVPNFVDSINVFKFIDDVYGLGAGNPIQPFELSQDITGYLKNQWAGLFQRLLQKYTQTKERESIADLKRLSDTLYGIVLHLTKHKDFLDDNNISQILLHEHPAFNVIRNLLDIPYRVAFRSKDELSALLNVRGFSVNQDNDSADYMNWDNPKAKTTLCISSNMFDKKGNLKAILPGQWKDDLITLCNWPARSSTDISGSFDDIPF